MQDFSTKSSAHIPRRALGIAAVLMCLFWGAACGVDETGQGSLVVPTSVAGGVPTPDDDAGLSVGENDPDPTVAPSPTSPAPEPTSTTAPAVTPTPGTPTPGTPTPGTPTAEATEPTPGVPSPPFATATARSTVAPQATATQQPAPRPTATARPSVAATAVPRPTNTPESTATPAPTSVPATPVVTCSVSKQTVAVGEPLSFQASSTPASVSVAFTFDHGNGTLDPGRRSDAFYTRNGQYRVRLQWVAENGDGEVDCQTVTVLDANGCHISLGPADGLGWRCGSTWCPANPLQPASGCPTVAPHGCYIGQDGQPYCIDEGGPSPTPTPVPQRVTDVGCSISPSGPVEVGQALVFQASALPAGVPISFVFAHGDGTLDPGARSDAYYTAPGSYAVQVQWTGETQSGVVDCGTVVVVASQPDTFNLTCTILDSEIRVGEITEFRAEVSGQAPPLSVAFLHGDGTRDARAVSQAFYNAPGVYPVTLEWATDVASGTMNCGSVTVT